MTKYKLINSATEKHTWITSWVKLKYLELSVFALEKRERLSANMVAHQSAMFISGFPNYNYLSISAPTRWKASSPQITPPAYNHRKLH